MSDKKQEENTDEPKRQSELLRQVFDDFDARTNFVGVFDLLYKIDRRLEPERYEDAEVARGQPLP